MDNEEEEDGEEDEEWGGILEPQAPAEEESHNHASSSKHVRPSGKLQAKKSKDASDLYRSSTFKLQASFAILITLLYLTF